MILAKFGGSSVANSHQFKKVKNIVNSDANKKYVVVSAPGKDEQHAFKITELLIKLYHARPNSINFKNLHAEIMQRFYNIIDELNLDKSLKLLVTNTFSNVKKLSYAKLVSRGEYLNAQIMANYLGWHFVDTNDFLIIENGQINYVASQLRLANIMHNDDKIVFPGFYGVNFNGEIQLLPRGGGDTSGAAISNLLGVDKYENWTDIDGIQVVDPHIIKNSVKIDSLSYDELQELSYMGLSVFQEDSINPLKNKNIPLVIRNTNHPHRLGTTISNQNSSSDITGVIGDQEYSLISIKKYGLAKETNNMIAILNVLNQFNLEIKCMVSEFDSINLFVKNIEKIGQLEAFLVKNNISAKVQSNIALVAVISQKVLANNKLQRRIIDILEKHHINSFMFNQSSNDIKFLFGIYAKDYQRAIKIIYQSLFEKNLVTQAL